MWMHMSDARWEVGWLVHAERINNALHEAEQARLVRAVQGSKTRRTFRDVLNSARATLRAVNLRTAHLQPQEPFT